MWIGFAFHLITKKKKEEAEEEERKIRLLFSQKLFEFLSMDGDLN